MPDRNKLFFLGGFDFRVLGILYLACLLPIVIILYCDSRIAGWFPGYPLDDTYIHMSIAKNIANQGVWGIDGSGYASASSSLLYTCILAALFFVFSPLDLIPLIVNVLVALILITVLDRKLLKSGVRRIGRLAIGLAAIFLTPFHTLVLTGMEHMLQCLFSFLLLTGVSEVVYGKVSRNQKIFLPLFSFLVVAIRYEGLFLLFVVVVALILFARFYDSMRVGFFGLLPIVVFGIISIKHGGMFFPNSVLLKSPNLEMSAASIFRLLFGIIAQKLTISDYGTSLITTQRLLLLLPGVILLSYKRIKFTPHLLCIGLLTVVVVFHLSFASTGWLYRYEAYLVFLAVYTVGVIAAKSQPKEFKPDWIVGLCASVVAYFVFFPVLMRSGSSFFKTKRAILNIYDQQQQMARFTNRYYLNSVIALNDIGAVSFSSSGKIIDLWGLGNNSIAKLKRQGTLKPEYLDSVCRSRGVDVAIIYQSWFDSSLYKTWSPVAQWSIRNNVICGDDKVTFYAVDSLKKAQLFENLKAFEKDLPHTTFVKYLISE